MVSLITTSFLIALMISLLLIRWGKSHAKNYADNTPQRFHVGNVPRLGGIAMAIGLGGGWLLGPVGEFLVSDFSVHMSWRFVWPWLLILIPAVCGGVLEDATQRLAPRYRLLMTCASAILACVLLGVRITRIDVGLMDQALTTLPWLGMLLAAIAITGLPHAFNMIDGYNGLAGIVAVFVCLAFAHVCLQLGDRELAAIVLCLAGASIGFLAWNYPNGLLFAGDGGAYLWGLVTSCSGILLVQRHAEVSPWFVLLCLIYPVWEVVFSVYRKLARGHSPAKADALHFHQLIYRRIVRSVFHADHPEHVLSRNNRTSPYLWGFALATIIPAVLFWSNTGVLMMFCLLFVVSYVAAYIAIVRFKVPRWLRV